MDVRNTLILLVLNVPELFFDNSEDTLELFLSLLVFV